VPDNPGAPFDPVTGERRDRNKIVGAIYEYDLDRITYRSKES